MTKRLTTLIFSSLLLFQTASAAETPEQALATERLHAALIESMQGGDAMSFDERVQLLSPVISDTFDFPSISRVVLGRYWRELSEQDRLRFIEVFTKLSIATYASRFDSYDGERFQLLETEKLKRNQFLVKNELIGADGTAISMHYLVHDHEGIWKILNVIADGISDLSLKRSEYASILESQGFDTLLGMLQQKLNEAAS